LRAARLQCIIVTLLDHAVSHTAPGGSISVRVTPQGPAALLEIRDAGIGIAPGRGWEMSLAVVRRLVALHDGTVAVASEGPGYGNRFTITLPRVRQPAPP
jgi:signal transduction histidine kinase